MWETDVPLATLTRYRIGGLAPRFARLETMADLLDAVRSMDGLEYRVLGWGANVLVSDRGVSEPVLTLTGEFDSVLLSEHAMEAGAGAGLPALVGDARRGSRTGWEFLEAVPGSVGGGLRMNAGSVDVGVWDRVLWAEAATPAGELIRMSPADARPTYRCVDVPGDWVFTAASFEAPAGEAEEVHSAHVERRRQKIESQVYELPTCGSIWKNPGPPHGSAWEVVDRAGMRGAIHGGAQITERHANFIANLGDATAADVLWLMSETRRRVADTEGIWLQPEICLWGFDAEELDSVGAAA
ncbi:MAG: FAD-binding protein [marine benthic group bacterium]|nr:FAD-binding protein [Candidatus Benthicola marisminoris]